MHRKSKGSAHQNQRQCIAKTEGSAVQKSKTVQSKIEGSAQQTQRQCNLCTQGSAKKKFVEKYQHETSFQDLDATSTAVKTGRNLDARFKEIFCILYSNLKERENPPVPSPTRGLSHTAASGALWFTHGWENLPQCATYRMGRG